VTYAEDGNSTGNQSGSVSRIGHGWYSINLGEAFVNREFFIAAIRYYRDNPTARATVGG